MLNDHFVQSEIEYLRQQRLAAAAEYRRAKSAKRIRSLRERLSAIAERLTPARAQQEPVTRLAPRGVPEEPVEGLARGAQAEPAGRTSRAA
jgi:hypothetical protein